MAEGWSLSFELFRTFLPKPKYSITGPGGVEASFDWRAAFDEATARCCGRACSTTSPATEEQR